MKFNNIVGNIRKKVLPTDKEIALDKGKAFVNSIISSYSVEEQSATIIAVVEMLKEQRLKDIAHAEQELERLKKDLDGLQKYG